MQDEVRVTVVATGLNRVSASKTQRPGERAPIKLVRNATTGQPEFGDFDNGGDAVSKAVGGMGLGLRRASSDTAAASAPSAPSASAPAAAELPNDYLDIPAFLRRQAD
jgi:cell division protein FtsZ